MGKPQHAKTIEIVVSLFPFLPLFPFIYTQLLGVYTPKI
jgi:hypothetical protein